MSGKRVSDHADDHADAVAADAAAALSAVAMTSSSDPDTVARPHPLLGKVEAAECRRLKRCLALTLGVLGEQRGAESHAALSRARGALGEGGAGASAVAEVKNYIDMSAMQGSDSEAILEQEHAQREQENRLRLGATLSRMSAASGHYYNLLFGIIEAPSTSAELRELVWNVLMHLPTLRAKYDSIEDQQFTRWSGVLGPETGPWRSLYALQIVDAMLLPGDDALRDASKLRRAVEWRRRFLMTGGLEQLIAFALTVDKHPCWHHRHGLERSVCLPLLARILKSCVAGALSDLKVMHASSGAGGASGGRSFAIPASPGSKPLSSPALSQGETMSMSLGESGAGNAGALVQGKDDSRRGGGSDSQDGEEVLIDMGLMTRQLLSFLLQATDDVDVSEEHRAALTQALSDGLSVIRQLLCAGGAGTQELLHASATSGASITIGHGIIDTFFNEGCADDVIDGILLRHPQQVVRNSAKQLLHDMAMTAAHVPLQASESTRSREPVFLRIMAHLLRRLPGLDQSSLVAAQFFQLLGDFALEIIETQEIIEAQTRREASAGVAMQVGWVGGGGGEGMAVKGVLGTAMRQLAQVQDAILAMLNALDDSCEDAFVCEVLLCVERIATASVAWREMLVDKGLVTRILREFLMKVPDAMDFGQKPFCQDAASREAAWRIVRMLVSLNPGPLANEVVSTINAFLRNVRLPSKVDGTEDWQYKHKEAAQQKRKGMPYIGLRNPGARCYMNSMLQFFHEIEEFRDCICNASEGAPPADEQEDTATWGCPVCTMRNGWDADTCNVCGTGKRPDKPAARVPRGEVLRQLRRTMHFMLHSELSSFDSVDMMTSCKDIGMHKAIELQNDTTEFFQRLLERLETELSPASLKSMKRCFRARMLTQRVSAECAHSKPPSSGPFEKALNVSVAGMGSLEKALVALVKPSLITGGNRVVCEDCSAAAGSTVRRAYWEYSVLERETISPTLVINLKRFTVRASQGGANVKINDYLSFPLTLDLAPYVRSAAHEVTSPAVSPPSSPLAAGSADAHMAYRDRGIQGAEREDKQDPLLYHLRGIIVHKGEASHGHYYCFMHKPGTGWFRIDDEKVQPFDLEKGVVDKHPPPGSSAASYQGGGEGCEGLSALAEECFGGVDSKNKALGKKVRNHNAFVLLYQRAATDRQVRGSAGHSSHDDVMSSSSSDAPRSPAPTQHADPAVKDLQAATVSRQFSI